MSKRVRSLSHQVRTAGEKRQWQAAETKSIFTLLVQLFVAAIMCVPLCLYVCVCFVCLSSVIKSDGCRLPSSEVVAALNLAMFCSTKYPSDCLHGSFVGLRFLRRLLADPRCLSFSLLTGNCVTLSAWPNLTECASTAAFQSVTKMHR